MKSPFFPQPAKARTARAIGPPDPPTDSPHFPKPSKFAKIAAMCRSIKKLRRTDLPATDQEMYEAALQFVRKVSGYRVPSRANQETFELAIDEIAASTKKLLKHLETK